MGVRVCGFAAKADVAVAVATYVFPPMLLLFGTTVAAAIMRPAVAAPRFAGFLVFLQAVIPTHQRSKAVFNGHNSFFIRVKILDP